jgi:hypothetical protein
MNLKSISQSLQNAAREVMEGKIKHPNQQKLDVHEPEKDELTAKDFEMLRAGKKAKMKEDTDVTEAASAELKAKRLPMIKAAVKMVAAMNKSAERAAKRDMKKPGGTKGMASPDYEKDVNEEIVSEFTFADYLQAAKQLYSEEEAVRIANDVFNLQETEDKAITRKVHKSVGRHHASGEHAVHITKTDSGHHLYYHDGDDYAGYHEYVVHHPNGKITSHTVHNERKKITSSDMDNENLHPSVKKAIIKDINDHVS